MYYPGAQAIPVNNISVDHFAAVYPPPGLPVYPGLNPGLPYQQFFPYYSLPMVSFIFMYPFKN